MPATPQASQKNRAKGYQELALVMRSQQGNQPMVEKKGKGENRLMRINELTTAYALAVKAAEDYNTPTRERRLFQKIAHHIYESCGGTDRTHTPDQAELIAAADREEATRG